MIDEQTQSGAQATSKWSTLLRQKPRPEQKEKEQENKASRKG